MYNWTVFLQTSHSQGLFAIDRKTVITMPIMNDGLAIQGCVLNPR